MGAIRSSTTPAGPVSGNWAGSASGSPRPTEAWVTGWLRRCCWRRNSVARWRPAPSSPRSLPPVWPPQRSSMPQPIWRLAPSGRHGANRWCPPRVHPPSSATERPPTCWSSTPKALLGSWWSQATRPSSFRVKTSRFSPTSPRSIRRPRCDGFEPTQSSQVRATRREPPPVGRPRWCPHRWPAWPRPPVRCRLNTPRNASSLGSRSARSRR